MKNSSKNSTDKLLKELADKYETSDFISSDPSQFLKRYKRVIDIEVFSFTAAMLSFGSRKQFIPKIEYLAELADMWAYEKGMEPSFAAWVMSGDYRKTLISDDGNTEKKFYRFYSYDDLYVFFDEMQQILRISGSFGRFLRESWQDMQSVELREAGIKESESFEKIYPLDRIIGDAFSRSRLVPKGKNSANKRIHMFLRWMVRINSPVDLGLWTWYNPKDLLIPLDVHVMKESIKLGLISETSKPDRKTAVLLTERLKEIWPCDPCKGDFSLFGLGIDKEQKI
ncbi:MAG: TIGR02757 family protein [Treponema sp.]|nr:TIGR02757 family protein [Treponema sp.]